jgi:hypothetical protein
MDRSELIMVQCQTCGGRYESVQADGTLYFHVCPPLSPGELEAAIADGTVTLSPAHRARLEAARKADQANPRAPDGLSQELIVLSTIAVLRPDHRDENPISTRPRERERDAIKAVGKGDPLPVPDDTADTPPAA